MEASHDITIGTYTGEIAGTYRDPAFLKELAGIEGLMGRKDAVVLAAGRNRNVRVPLFIGGRSIDVVIKAFPAPGSARRILDGGKGSKARRTWIAASHLAAHGVGTPAPIGFLESSNNGKPGQSYFLSEYSDNVRSFKDELIYLFRHNSNCDRFIALMQCVADAVRAMHRAGFLHNDLGNQNILLRRREAGGWGDVQFIDLNRGRIRSELSPKERGRDISRLYLPSDLMRVFKEMCFAPKPPPAEFLKWEKFYRRLYAVHSGTRRFRHPFRTRRLKQLEAGQEDYPSEKDMWIWDERSGQAISALRSRDRARYYGWARNLQIVEAIGAALGPLWVAYSMLRRQCYQKPVSMKNRVGVALNLTPATVDRELALLEELGEIPVFVRFYAHETEKEWSFLAHMVKTLHREGRNVSIALVQDRRSVLDPKAWAVFASGVMERVYGCVDYVEIGHAINRVKWGIWDFADHKRVVDGVAAIAHRFPDVRFMGPAVIDFEYPFVLAALRNIPEKLSLSALSHHLYVDRRGAPENRQGLFSALEKFVLARAIAKTSNVCEDRLVVSEVNWPLKGTGVHSPVGSPYESPGPRFNDPSVTEDEYADYMLRYLLMAICSGMVDRVYWWRLAARGYGLVDDTDPKAWRKRPAYVALKHFIEVLGESEFSGRMPSRDSDVQMFMFLRPDRSRVCVAYSKGAAKDFDVPFGISRVTGALGESMTGSRGMVCLTGRPVYVFLEK